MGSIPNNEGAQSESAALTLNPFDVNGIALITGAGSGIGKDTGFALATAGASGIAFADLDFANAQQYAKESRKYATNPSYDTLAIEVDVADEASVRNMVGLTVEKFGRIDYNVNSAGVYNKPYEFKSLNIEELDRLYKINVRGMALCMRYVLEAMSKQDERIYESRSGQRSLGRGSIVNLGSLSSHVSGAQSAPYITTKHATIGLSKAAAFDSLDHNIRVNTVCPSFVDTTMTAPMVEYGKLNPGFMQFMLPRIGRMAVPEEVSGAIVFLLGPSATYINGTSMLIDAGQSMTARA